MEPSPTAEGDAFDRAVADVAGGEDAGMLVSRGAASAAPHIDGRRAAALRRRPGKLSTRGPGILGNRTMRAAGP